MSRLLSLLAVGGLVAVILALPTADRGRLAALDLHTMLEGSGEIASPAELLFTGPLVERTDEGYALRLGEVRVAPLAEGGIEVGEPAWRDDLAALARRAFLRGLREQAAGEKKRVDVEGERAPVPDGMEVTLRYGEKRRELEYGRPDAAPTGAIVKDWTPAVRTSVVPPIVAILLAILLRRPVISLLLGVYAASVLVQHGAGDTVGTSLWLGAGKVFQGYFLPQLEDGDRQLIIGFVVFMLAMVGVLTKSGGIRGLMDGVAHLARSARGTQLAAYVIGLLIFFDDYANTILCGSTMRPLTDRFRVSREKLAYIVDSTAAPVAGLSVLSTWIAFEVSTFSAQLPAAGLDPKQGYQVFIQTLPFRFYCILTIAFVFLVVWTGRDFGPMLTAERRARRTGRVVREGGKPMIADTATMLEPAPGVKPCFWSGLVPILLFLGISFFEILRLGGAFSMPFSQLFTLQGFAEVLGATTQGALAPPYGATTAYWALFLGSLCGFLAACVFALVAGLRGEIVAASWATLRSMGIAIVILYLAWMLGSACKELHTAEYLTALLGDRLNPAFLPAILFLLSATVAFSTGSSWSTMTILLPIVVGLAFNLGEDSGFLGPNSGFLLLLMTIGAVLEGAIFGDHCSPISDTTVLSSVASASDHVDHVRTQAPYAVLTMTVALVAGYVPCAFLGWSPWLGTAVGLTILFLVLRLIGRRVDEPLASEAAADEPITA